MDANFSPDIRTVSREVKAGIFIASVSVKCTEGVNGNLGVRSLDSNRLETQRKVFALDGEKGIGMF